MKLKNCKQGFTLAELLIVIGAIGTVAALTIPTLINTISTKAKKAQTDVIETRLLDGLNRYSTMEDGLSKPYETTKEFLEGLSKYYKMSAICDNNEITKCIPYAKMFYNKEKDGVKAVKSVNVSYLTSADMLMSPEISDNYLPPASFISAQGTPFVIALKKGCIWDTGKAMTSIEESECISLMYDKNGVNLPNKFGDDIIGMGLSPERQPYATLGGIKIMTKAFTTKGLTKAQCEAEMAKEDEYTKIPGGTKITSCPDFDSSGGDWWAYSMKHCKDLGFRLPNANELKNMANALYIGMNANNNNGSYTYPGKDENGNYYKIGSKEPLPNAFPSPPNPGSFIFIWSSTTLNANGQSLYRGFNETSTIVYYGNHGGHTNKVIYGICVSD